jgi:hypothetical protein
MLNLLLTAMVVVLIMGIMLYLINTYIPMDAKIKSIINIIVVLGILIWLVSLLMGHALIVTR